jgi:ribosome-associated protein
LEMEQAVDTSVILRKARGALEDKKGLDIVDMDISGYSTIADHFLLVTGNSAPHIKAMADEVQFMLKKDGIHCYHRTGLAESGWVVLDYVDVIIHIFSSETRKYYGIENLWESVPRRKSSSRSRK